MVLEDLYHVMNGEQKKGRSGLSLALNIINR